MTLTPQLYLVFFWPVLGMTVLLGKCHRLLNHGTTFTVYAAFSTGHQMQGFTTADSFAGRELNLAYCSVNGSTLFIRSVDKITTGDPFFVPEFGC